MPAAFLEDKYQTILVSGRTKIAKKINFAHHFILLILTFFNIFCRDGFFTGQKGIPGFFPVKGTPDRGVGTDGDKE
jgi:hypothetical protein